MKDQCFARRGYIYVLVFVRRLIMSCEVVIFHNRNKNLILFLHSRDQVTELSGSLLYLCFVGW